MDKARPLVAALAVLGTLFTAVSPARSDAPEGRWLTQDKSGMVEVYRCGDALCGRLLWFRMQALHDNPQALDIHNPTPGLRNRPLCGLVLLSGFRPESQNHWSGGSAYDPQSGHTYSGEMTMQPDGHLSLRGYIGISLFGRSEEWTRYTQPIPRCPAG
jgi:uncharacterized protein (DUF2147 family)